MSCSTSPNPPTSGDTAFVILSGALVFIMTPGLGFFYGGMARSKHFLSTVMTSMLAIAVVTIQWFLFGYSITFSQTSKNSFIGNLDNGVLIGVGADPHVNAPCVPALAYMFYELMFAIITPALAFGGAAERATLHSFMVFVIVWSTLVYDIVAYWTWNVNGWLNKLGALDFAGGGPVHLASGCAALAYAIVIGHREGYGKETFRPHNLSHVILGTALLWFGWFGFNAGSECAANARAANAAVVTHLAASIAGLTWMGLDYWFASRKLTSMGFCAGCVSGLVAITPAAGYVTPASSLAIGCIGACCCFSATHLKTKFGFDDAMDVFAVHGVGGATGSILTGIFAQSWVFTLDGSSSNGGWLSYNFERVGYQLAGICAIGGWSFCVSFIILTIMDKIPWIGLRVPPEHESIGTDLALMGELAYRYETNYQKRPTLAQVNPQPENGVEMQTVQTRESDKSFTLPKGS